MGEKWEGKGRGGEGREWSGRSRQQGNFHARFGRRFRERRECHLSLFRSGRLPPFLSSSSTPALPRRRLSFLPSISVVRYDPSGLFQCSNAFVISYQFVIRRRRGKPRRDKQLPLCAYRPSPKAPPGITYACVPGASHVAAFRYVTQKLCPYFDQCTITSINFFMCDKRVILKILDTRVKETKILFIHLFVLRDDISSSQVETTHRSVTRSMLYWKLSQTKNIFYKSFMVSNAQ